MIKAEGKRGLIVSFFAFSFILFIGIFICPFFTLKEYNVYKLLTGSNAIETKGVVLYKEYVTSQESNYYVFYIEFKDKDLNSHMIQSMFNFSDDSNLYIVGNSVPVVYNSNNPSIARINSPEEINGVFIGVLVLNLLLIIMGGTGLLITYSKIKKYANSHLNTK